MTYDHIVIRYGEMSTKGKNRLQFVRCLKRNIAKKLKHFIKLTTIALISKKKYEV